MLDDILKRLDLKKDDVTDKKWYKNKEKVIRAFKIGGYVY